MIKEKTYFIPDKVGLGFGEEGNHVKVLQRFLKRFGYLREPSIQEESLAAQEAASAPTAEFGRFDEATELALREYQTFFRIESTGILDVQTIEIMRKPRCGVQDIYYESAETIASSPHVNGWEKNDLTYGFNNFSPYLTKKQIRDAIRSALNLWSNVTSLTFNEVSPTPKPDFLIRFVAGNHWDGSPFDGIGHVYAHAFPLTSDVRSLAGEVHFDKAEKWTVNNSVPDNGIDLIIVAAHEFGHALGLEHSTVPEALMYPDYSVEKRALHQDDITRIQSIYPLP